MLSPWIIKRGWELNFQGNNDIPYGNRYCPISFLSLQQYLLFCPELVRWIPFKEIDKSKKLNVLCNAEQIYFVG
jgi:hypothetical protein